MDQTLCGKSLTPAGGGASPETPLTRVLIKSQERGVVYALGKIAVAGVGSNRR